MREARRVSEFRQDPVTGIWTLIVPERAGRPKDFSRDPAEAADPAHCPLCAGHESMTPPTLFEAHLPGRPDWITRVVDNRFPALAAPPDVLGCDDLPAPFPYRATSGFGGHEVIVETPDHHEELADFSAEHARAVVDTFVERVRHWRDDGRVAHAVLFRNWGEKAGASLAHPHTQLLAAPRAPATIVRELGNFVEHAGAHDGACVLCDAMAADDEGGRAVFDDGVTVVHSPYAAPIPYALRIAPRRHGAGILDLSAAERDSLGAALVATARALGGLFGAPAFNMVWHLAPYRVEEIGALPFHWHVELILRTSDMAGYEWGSGGYLNVIDPDEAARALRGALGVG